MGESKPAKIYCFAGNGVKACSLMGTVTFGRSSRTSSPDIAVDVETVSRRHGVFRPVGSGWIYENVSQSNGTIWNGKVMQNGGREELHDGDILRVCCPYTGDSSQEVVLLYTESYHLNSGWKRVNLEKTGGELTVGYEVADLRNGRAGFRAAARFCRTDDGWKVGNIDGIQRIFVNGMEVSNEARMRFCSLILVNGYILFYTGKYLLVQFARQGTSSPAGVRERFDVYTTKNIS